MATNKAVQNGNKLKWNRKVWLLVIGIIFIASTLRAPLTSVGPIISFIRDGLHISNVLAGFITTIPLLAFAAISPLAPKFSKRFGIERTLLFSTALLAVGILTRSLGTTPTLLLGTSLIGVAIAFGNVLLPSLIKLKFPLQVGLLTGIFTVSMNLSASLAAGISYPLASGELGWRIALGIWFILAIIAIIVWLPQIRKSKSESNIGSETNKEHIPLWKSPLTWTVTLAMGFQSLIFYTTAAWIPEMLQSQGMSANTAGWMFSFMQFSQLPATFMIPIIAGRRKDQRPLVIVFGVLYLVGFGGILAGWTSLTVLWMILLGLAGGASFSLAMMYFSLRTRTAHEAAELSGTAQSLGYLLAAIGPVLFGYVHDITNSWTTAIILFIFTVLLLVTVSMHAAKEGYVTPEK
ncbi:MFS transporter [Viridibacillus sp. FSL R5-0477]|uniref:Cyanate transporter n=1 Tax=Viridibacillus arenosi FSL R5-213 TaxID=1227360 RepID=W4F501_9BACL|nr:MFS transporter [Viridibacillus arenosi]ETT87432.1 cyanate transporter [Viridibacillus arenosi FSL R5-213]OMC91299.1 MFS transporter [Viridibacillus arenosi]